MKKIMIFLFLLFFLTGVLFLNSFKDEEAPLIGARFPEISPDGKQIAFSYMGDLWVVSSDGGAATRLTDHVAYDREPVWSPDGKLIAFTSNRMGNNDVFIMKVQGGKVHQMTFHSGNDIATDFTPDGEWVIFRSSRHSGSGIYKINVKSLNPLPLLDTYWSRPFHAKVNPDSESMLFALGGEHNSWWRRGYRGSNTAKLWIKEFSKKTAKLIVEDTSNCFWPDWDIEGEKVYFVSDRELETKNIWVVNKDGSDLQAVTRFPKNDVKWLSVSSKEAVAAFERDFGIWVTDLNTRESRRILIDAPAETKENQTFYVENTSVSEYRLSPDGKKIAVVVRGDIFVLSSEGGYARNITNSPWRESQIDWDKESQNLVFISDSGANPDMYIVSAKGDQKAHRLTQSGEDELRPRFSPDGKWIAYYRGKRQVRIIKPDGKEDSLVLEDDFGGRFGATFAWSPDSRFLAVDVRRNSNWDVFAVDTQTENKWLLTNTAYDENNSTWSSDGKFLLFS